MVLAQKIPVVIAFLYGFISFFTPCVLPLIPAYISFITGLSLSRLTEINPEDKKKGRIIFDILMFVLGFSLVFIAMGASATFLGVFLVKNQRILRIAGGAVIVVFGLHTTGLVRIKYLEYEKRIHPKSKPMTVFGSMFIGMAFAIGWTPCIGPILGAILTVAATRETLIEGVFLLGAFSLGLGIPFIITGLAINKFLNIYGKIKKYFQLISVASGLLIIVIGVLLMTGRFFF
jgi:cytochrome c-type biogenesis protein